MKIKLPLSIIHFRKQKLKWQKIGCTAVFHSFIAYRRAMPFEGSIEPSKFQTCCKCTVLNKKSFFCSIHHGDLRCKIKTHEESKFSYE